MRNLCFMLWLCLSVSRVEAFPWSQQVAQAEIGEHRIAKVFLPDNYDDHDSWPVLILLHGYHHEPNDLNNLWRISHQTTSAGYVLVVPRGIDRGSGPAWNATPLCCADDESVDDTSYLLRLMDQVIDGFNVDPEAIYLLGYSNGGFMAFTMACKHADRLAGLISIAGSTYRDPAVCRPSHPLSVLHIHGTHDRVVPFETGEEGVPGAHELVERWAHLLECQLSGLAKAALNIIPFNVQYDPSINGDNRWQVPWPWQWLNLEKETDVTTFDQCAGDKQVTLWQINGASHFPTFRRDFVEMAWRTIRNL